MAAFSFFKPQTGRDWRSFGAFSAFLVALFTEMYGFPLTIYLLSGWLQTRFPQVDWFSHDGGHLLEMLFGWKANPHFGPFHLLSFVFIGDSFILISSAWRELYEAQKQGRLAMTGPYGSVRHPQYVGFFVADLLSTDAVQISPGSLVRIDGWGGSPIQGRVSRIDLAGFLKVSALGIEEQRVHVTIDFVDPPETWSRLGLDYRVIVHVPVWSSQSMLMAPVGALFRKGDDWAVFVVKDGRARTTLIRIDHRNNRSAEIVSGMAAGDRVILHPSDRVEDGVRVVEREIR
jgi:protein-S-isoprenylcysteine O-methyltransferase Ste14